MVHHNVKWYVMLEYVSVIASLLDQEQPVPMLGGCGHVPTDIIERFDLVADEEESSLGEVLLQKRYEGFHRRFVAQVYGVVRGVVRGVVFDAWEFGLGPASYTNSVGGGACLGARVHLTHVT